nr:helix-turn-helix domain-containing protein [Arenibacter sp. F20364]
MALRINPLSANLYFTKGNMIYFKKNYKEAIVLFEKALSLNPFLPLALEMKAAALVLDRQPDELASFVENTPQLERSKTCRAIYDLMHNANIFNISKQEVEKEFIEASELSLRAWDLYYEIYIGNHEKALNILDSKIKERSGQLFNFRNDPFLEPLRAYKKYREIEDSVFLTLDSPRIIQEPTNPVSPSPFDDSQIDNFSKALESVMQEEKLFIDSELSLKQLAVQISLHPNKLSWLLNNHFGKNFNDFINAYRLEYFKQIAIKKENKNITLLGLAYDSGFNSKTVFNTFFKKETGMTPKQWVKANTP